RRGTEAALQPVRAAGVEAMSAARAVFWTVVAPIAASLATLRYLVPSRIDGGERGFWAVLATLGERHPLLLGIAFFFLFALTFAPWRRALVPGGVDGGRAAAALAVVLVAALAGRASVVGVYRVVSPSMVPTFNAGDRLLVDKRAYGWRLPLSRHAFGARPP